MYGDILSIAVPIMIVASFFSFLWALVLTAVKSPGSLEDKTIQVKTDAHWSYGRPDPKESEEIFGERLNPQLELYGIEQKASQAIEPQITVV